MKRAAVTCLALTVVASSSVVPPALSTHDQIPPETSITAGPGPRTSDRTPRFAFKANEPSVFLCKRDGKRFKPCTSPKTLAPLSYGRHGFYVRAIDGSSNKDATAAAYTFKVVRP